MGGWTGRGAAVALTLLAGVAGSVSWTPALARFSTGPSLTVERVVLLMRHGVRPPTKNPPMPAGTAAEPWPAWGVPPGYLTERGAKAVTQLGAFDRRVIAAGLIARGCPARGAVRVYSDSDQRTIATGDAWIAGFAPGCAIAHDHKPEGTPDPMFDPIELGGIAFDPARATAEVRAHLGRDGLQKLEASQRATLERLDRIYCGPTLPAGCGFAAKPTTLIDARAEKEPKLSGGLDLGSTAGQILLLEYADGKPMREVGWGRATAADIEAVSALHAIEYGAIARTPYLAAANVSAIARRMLASLSDTAHTAPVLDLIVGHDGNVAALAGMLDLHWKVGGFAADDPSPGGALGFELVRDARGDRYVRAFYRSQTLDQIRGLAPLAGTAPVQRLTIDKCPGSAVTGACPLDTFVRLVAGQLPPAR